MDRAMTAFVLLVLAVLATVLFAVAITVAMTAHRQGTTRAGSDPVESPQRIGELTVGCRTSTESPRA